MGLEYFTIKPESGPEIKALFNPNKLVIAKSVRWEEQKAKERDVPELQFKSGEPRTLNVELIFDTYDTPEAEKESVQNHTDKLLKLALVDGHKHRPPVCELSWGKLNKDFFKGVLEKLDQEFSLFMENGTPVRATCRCTFKEWRTDQEDQQKRNPKSSDVVKTRIVKRGDTLSRIAAEMYLDPRLWRPIANENGVDDPLNLTPGAVLLIPTLMYRNPTRRE
jgi:nucleoid-associated protein YgaU